MAVPFGSSEIDYNNVEDASEPFYLNDVTGSGNITITTTWNGNTIFRETEAEAEAVTSTASMDQDPMQAPLIQEEVQQQPDEPQSQDESVDVLRSAVNSLADTNTDPETPPSDPDSGAAQDQPLAGQADPTMDISATTNSQPESMEPEVRQGQDQGPGDIDLYDALEVSPINLGESNPEPEPKSKTLKTAEAAMKWFDEWALSNDLPKPPQQPLATTEMVEQPPEAQNQPRVEDEPEVSPSTTSGDEDWHGNFATIENTPMAKLRPELHTDTRNIQETAEQTEIRIKQTVSLKLSNQDLQGHVLVGVLHSHPDYRAKTVEGPDGMVFDAWVAGGGTESTLKTNVFIRTVNKVLAAVVPLNNHRAINLRFNTLSTSKFGFNQPPVKETRKNWELLIIPLDEATVHQLKTGLNKNLNTDLLEYRHRMFIQITTELRDPGRIAKPKRGPAEDFPAFNNTKGKKRKSEATEVANTKRSKLEADQEKQQILESTCKLIQKCARLITKQDLDSHHQYYVSLYKHLVQNSATNDN